MILDDLLLMFCLTTMVLIQVNGEQGFYCYERVDRMINNREHAAILRRLVIPHGVIIEHRNEQALVLIELV